MPEQGENVDIIIFTQSNVKQSPGKQQCQLELLLCRWASDPAYFTCKYYFAILNNKA